VGIAQVAGHLLRLHHAGALVGKRRFFRRFRSEALELLDRVAKKLGFALRPLDLGAVARHLVLACPPCVPKPLDLIRLAFEGAEGIEQPAVRRHVHQRTLVVLAVDFDQCRAQRLEGLRAHGLIVDEGAGASVGELHAAQDQLVLGRDVVGRHQRAHGVPGRQLERRGHLPLLGPLPHQGDIAPCTERERKGIEQDGFAGAGLAREHGQAGCEVDIEPVDQDDVANREPGQHACFPIAVVRSVRGSPCSRTQTSLRSLRKRDYGPATMLLVASTPQLERVPIRLNRERAPDSLFGRVFSRSRMFPTSAASMSDRNRVNPISVGEPEVHFAGKRSTRA
jgi:hypothetical protein